MFKIAQIGWIAVLLLSSLIRTSLPFSFGYQKEVKFVRERGTEYDRYLLATSWAGSTCKFHHCTHYGSDEIFNLHGLWPSTARASPFDCVKTNFKEQNLSPYLKQNLFIYWNSFYHDNWEFLDHEITKHGSCWRPEYGNLKVMDPSLASIIKTYDAKDDYSKINTFLTLTIELSMLINPYKVLKENGIVPSNNRTYNIDDIIAIFSNLHNQENTVMPVCLAEKSTGALYIAELRFCLDLEYKPIECSLGEMKRQLKRCRSSPLRYPLFPLNK